MQQAGQGELGTAGAATDTVGGLQHRDPHARKGKGDRCRQSVRS